jgi:hypothetical protein
MNGNLEVMLKVPVLFDASIVSFTKNRTQGIAVVTTASSLLLKVNCDNDISNHVSLYFNIIL